MGDRTLKPERILLIAVILFYTLTACNKKPEYIPGSSVQGFRAPISRILLSPLAFDGSSVAVEGMVSDIKTSKAHTGDIMTNFKLTDLDGNFINVEMPGTWKLADKDYIVVGGVYRRNGNIIEADQYEKIGKSCKPFINVARSFDKPSIKG
jgi:hypothetical protein